MALSIKDRVKETSTTTGTGTLTLAGAVTGFQAFSVIGDGNTTYYAITDSTNWEVGIGTYTLSGTTLSRDTVLESSNAGSLVNFPAGSKEVFVTYPAEKAISDGYGTLPIANGGTGATNAATALTNLGAYPASNPSGYTSNAGTVTSVAASAGTGISVTGSPITGSGTLTITNTAPDQTVTLTQAGTTTITGTYPSFTISSADQYSGTVTSVAISGGTTGLTTSGGPITTSGTITLGGTLAVANGGTGATTAFTAGSIAFAGASGIYSQDNANFFWDNTNKRFGVGTSAPAAPVHLSVSSNELMRLQNQTAGGSSGYIAYYETGGTRSAWVGYSSSTSNAFTINAQNASGSLSLRTANVERVNISSSGDTTFANSVRAPIFYDSSNTSYYLDPASTGTSLNVAGSIVAAGNVTAYSDIRVKDNVKQIEGALDKVQAIRGVTYNRTDLEDTERRYGGVVAQEIEQVLPEAIFENSDRKAVDYNATIGLLIEAVKELKAEVDTLRAEANAGKD